MSSESNDLGLDVAPADEGPTSLIVEAVMHGAGGYSPYPVGTFSDLKPEATSNVQETKDNCILVPEDLSWRERDSSLPGRVVGDFKPEYETLDLNKIQLDQGYIYKFSDSEITVTVDEKIAGILITELVSGRVHLKVTLNSFAVYALYDPGSSRKLIRKDLVPRILDSLVESKLLS